MNKTQYQPAEDQQLTAAQEVRYSKDFKRADIAGGFRKKMIQQARGKTN